MTYLKSQDKSPGTMDRALASIAVAHGAADLPKPSTVGARRVLKGHEAERKKSKDPRRRPPAPMADTPRGSPVAPSTTPLPRPAMRSTWLSTAKPMTDAKRCSPSAKRSGAM